MFFYLIYNYLNNKFSLKKNCITIFFGSIMYFIIHMFLFTGDRYNFYKEYIYYIVLCDILILFIKRYLVTENYDVEYNKNKDNNIDEPFKNDEIITEAFYDKIWIKNTDSKIVPELIDETSNNTSIHIHPDTTNSKEINIKQENKINHLKNE